MKSRPWKNSDTPEKLDYTRLAHIGGATAVVLAKSARLDLELYIRSMPIVSFT